VFGSIRKRKPGFTGFAKSGFNLKDKEKRIGSVSFDEDEF